MKVLMAVDDSPWSQAAVSFVQRMCWPVGSESIVVSAARPMPLVYSPDTLPMATAESIEAQRRHHAVIAERHAARLRGTFKAVRAEAVAADPREATLAADRDHVWLDDASGSIFDGARDPGRARSSSRTGHRPPTNAPRHRPRFRVSDMRTATTRPDAPVTAAINQIAASTPTRSATSPASSAPIAYPRSRHSR